jgi:hypothetical protein
MLGVGSAATLFHLRVPEPTRPLPVCLATEANGRLNLIAILNFVVVKTQLQLPVCQGAIATSSMLQPSLELNQSRYFATSHASVLPFRDCSLSHLQTFTKQYIHNISTTGFPSSTSARVNE